jgi:hypothetical protein
MSELSFDLIFSADSQREYPTRGRRDPGQNAKENAYGMPIL